MSNFNTMYLTAGVAAVLLSQSQAEVHEPCHCPEHSAVEERAATVSNVRIGRIPNVPSDLPQAFSVQVSYAGETLTLDLTKNNVFGANTRFLISGKNGVREIDLGECRTYLGTVAGQPHFSVSAILDQDGLSANIIRPELGSIVIEPMKEAGDSTLHRITVGGGGDQESPVHVCTADSHSQCSDVGCQTGEIAASVGKVTTHVLTLKKPSAKAAAQSTATLPPNRVMDVLEYEIGVEIGSRAFLSNTYNGNLTTAQNSAQSVVGNLDARYLHSCGIKHRLGTVMIREDAATDPLRASVTATGTAQGANSSLSSFRDYWNNNPQEVGNTHDLAVYHVRSSPSGLAYVNSVGSSNRYATSGGNGATSWADGTLAHEFGHSWSLSHYSASRGTFYEARPRSGNGANSAGGNNFHISVMDGSGDHNVGRLSTGEANQVFNVRQGKRRFGDLVENPDPIRPFGHRDEATTTGGPITIDVIANDYDANNDVLDVHLLDTVSFAGGTISLSAGTGPGGRNEVIYTPPPTFNGQDFFHYTVCDTTGRTDWGAVYVNGPVAVDLDVTKYFYDLGTSRSPLFAENSDPYQRLSDETFGDIEFTSEGPEPVRAIDRGGIQGVNNINRDHIQLRSPGEFRHKLAVGVYNAFFTIGDANESSAPIRFTAEGSVELTTETHARKTFTNYTVRNISVIDGQLNIRIENLGSSANITRIIITRVGDADVDEDEDELQDAWENNFFGNLTSTSGLPEEDADGDGLTDREEHDRGINPREFDSDGDGLSDFREVNTYGIDPALTDSDGDGFEDGVEVAYGSSPSQATSKPEIPGLVAYYTFDEGSGVTAKNSGSAGSDADATQNQGTIGWTTTRQKIGAASLNLNGSSSLLAESPIPDDATELTISVWVNPEADNGYKGIYAGRDNPGNWGINIENKHVDVRFATASGGSQGVDTADNSVIAANGWYHVALTWESTGSEAIGKIYLNGALAGQTTAARPDFTQPTEGFFLGDDPCCNNREFSGQIDDLAVFTRALSAEEISATYDAGQVGMTIISTMAPPIEPPRRPNPTAFSVNETNGNLNFNFNFQTQNGVIYEVHSSTDLKNWSLIDTVVGDGEAYAFSHNRGVNGNPARFYVIRY